MRRNRAGIGPTCSSSKRCASSVAGVDASISSMSLSEMYRPRNGSRARSVSSVLNESTASRRRRSSRNSAARRSPGADDAGCLSTAGATADVTVEPPPLAPSERLRQRNGDVLGFRLFGGLLHAGLAAQIIDQVFEGGEVATHARAHLVDAAA